MFSIIIHPTNRRNEKQNCNFYSVSVIKQRGKKRRKTRKARGNVGS